MFHVKPTGPMAGNDETGGIGDNDEWRRKVRATLDEHFEAIEALQLAHAEHQQRMVSFADGLEANTTQTMKAVTTAEAIKKDTGEIVEWLQAVKGFKTVLGWLSAGVKWMAAFVVALAILYAVWRTGSLPPPKL